MLDVVLNDEQRAKYLRLIGSLGFGKNKGFEYVDTEKGQRIKVFSKKPKDWYDSVIGIEQIEGNLVVYERNVEQHAGRRSYSTRISVFSSDSMLIKSKDYICGCGIGLDKLNKLCREEILV